MTEPVLSARGLTRRFGALLATDAVDLDLAPGEIHAVIGPNGAGKSTLVAQICGTLAPDAGTVRIAGRDVTRAPAAERARAGLARTFQVSQLPMEDTVLEAALLGAIARAGRPGLWARATGRPDLRGAAEAALGRVGLLPEAARPVAELSHGARRRLEVAIALTLAPRAFVMDEPMAGLGPDGTARMTALLEELKPEAPILLVEHDMDAVFRLADRISVMVEGRVIAQGPPGEIRADARVRAAYLGDAA